jgi:hypothetical protein
MGQFLFATNIDSARVNLKIPNQMPFRLFIHLAGFLFIANNSCATARRTTSAPTNLRRLSLLVGQSL